MIGYRIQIEAEPDMGWSWKLSELLSTGEGWYWEDLASGWTITEFGANFATWRAKRRHMRASVMS